MYGIVNKAIQGLILENYGQEKWDQIKKISNVSDDSFLSNESYPDEITYNLAGAASQALETSVENVLHAFGEYWILKTGQEKYGSLMKAGGENLKQFLMYLPSFHNHLLLIYPNLTPPEFRVSHVEDNSLRLHYISHRPGLKHFVLGLISGLGKMYETPIEVKIVADRDNGDHHEEFDIQW